MSLPDDINKKACDNLARAIEVDLFKGASSEDKTKMLATTSRRNLQKLTLRLLGWKEELWSDNFVKREVNGTIVDTIHVGPGLFTMESLSSILKNVTFDMTHIV